MVRMRLGGLMVPILQWLKGLFSGLCALVGRVVAVNGLPPSVCKTVAPFSCTSFPEHPAVISVTVAMV